MVVKDLSEMTEAELLAELARRKKVVDKPASSGIMTSEGGQTNGNGDDLQPERPRTEGEGLSETVRKTVSTPEEEQHPERSLSPEGQRSEGLRGEFDAERVDTGRGVEHGDKTGDTGERKRLKDIVLTESSDIGFDAGAASRFDANLKAFTVARSGV